ncbi:MAG: DUF2889 domain-containing protein [Candidatus Bathyarchaeia archaeon]
MGEILLHTRHIQIDVYSKDENTLLLKGHLVDRRHRQMDPQGKLAEVNRTIHDMNLTLTVKLPEQEITSVEATMDAVPYAGAEETRDESCRDILPTLKKLNGLAIQKGFTAKVREIIGDIKGCAHMTTLVLTTAPVAVQGIGALTRIKDFSRPSSLKRLLNTCYIWREQGALLSMFQVEPTAQGEGEKAKPST